MTALLTKHKDVCLDLLHKRLYDFYWRWGDGEFIDGPPENLPQRKMRELRNQFYGREDQLGQRQVDAYAGLNIMLLLLELHRHGFYQRLFLSQDEAVEAANLLAFHPCHTWSLNQFDKFRLMRVVAYSNLLDSYISEGPLIIRFLDMADLSEARLDGMNLASAKLNYSALPGSG